MLRLSVTLLFLPFLAFAEPESSPLERFRKGERDVATLAAILPELSSPEHRGLIRNALLDPEKSPRSELVACLSQPVLATRLAALEILEELSGGDLGYNPWEPATSPENEASLARWRSWTGEAATGSSSGSLFSKEQRRSYLRDILSGDPDKASRSRHMLATEGLPAAGFLEEFLQETPTLGPGHRASIREAQYQIVLSRQLGDQAPGIARHLAFGSRDQLLSALAAIRPAGLLTLPILRDFIAHPDALVRETAIDAFVATGGTEAVTIVAPILREEEDVNVIHGVMRRLKDVPGPATAALVASFLSHPDEDLLISAIQTSFSLSGGDPDSFRSSRSRTSTPSPADDLVIAALSDPRWRVRAAALEYIAKRTLQKAKPACIALLKDPDEFVRFAAITAIGSLGATEALPELDAMFMADESTASAVFGGYGALDRKPGNEILARLDSAAPEARLAALGISANNSSLRDLPLRYANDANPDVSASSLRMVASNSEMLENNQHASIIADALRSEKPEKLEAVLTHLSLPSGKFRNFHSGPETSSFRGGPTTLDPLYDAFLLPGSENPSAPSVPNALSAIIGELLRLSSPGAPPTQRYQAALHLAGASLSEGFAILLEELPTYTTAQKIRVSESLREPSNPDSIPLLTALLSDPVSEVRSAAAEAILSNETGRVFHELLFSTLARPSSPLEPHETYGYRFESIVRSRQATSGLRDWSLDVLQAEASPPALRVLALIALRGSTPSTSLEIVRQHTTAADALVRRAAWHTLLILRPAELSTAAEAITGDHHAFVRIVLPSALHQSSREWQHRFSDIHVLHDSRWIINETTSRLTRENQTILHRLATHDPSPAVRFESAFTLLSHGEAIDVDAFVTLVPLLPTDHRAADRITQWMWKNAPRLTPALSPLLAVVNPARLGGSQLEIIKYRLQPSKENSFATFASLASGTTEPSGKLLASEPENEPPAERTSVEVVYFYKAGCPECIRAKEYLESIRQDFPLLSLHEHNILDTTGTLFNQALSARFSVPSARHTLTPAIFTQAGFLIREEITPPTLAKLLSDTAELPQDDSWLAFGETERQAASVDVDRRYAAFTLPLIIGAGLLDGLNPCAFATIIFFLSYLQIARRTPREMLLTGLAFISAVFIAYLSAGLILHQSLTLLNDRFAGIQKWLNTGFALLALLAAFLSFRDAFRARAGRLGEMTLQLPGFLKNRIRGVIRTSARARNFIAAAFIAGIIVSLLELACTGQVYAPIIYQIQQGRLDAVLWLVIYNLAFITPLVIVFLLAYGGLRSETLIAFQKKHTAAVKIGLGILFLILAAFIFFGKNLLPS